MGYLQESGASIHRRRRRQREVVTLTVVMLLLAGTFMYAAAYVQGGVGTQAADSVASKDCRRASRAITLPMVPVNVYNATTQDGLAASVAESLQSQGFKVVKVGNDPLSMAIRGVGEIRRGPTGAAGATLAAMRLRGARVVPDDRTDDSVDFVLGNRFTALSTPPSGARSQAVKAVSSC